MPAISRASAILGLAALAVTACGSQSSANDNANAAAPASDAVATPGSETALPIEQGVYIGDYMDSCASADTVFFYDGAAYGHILQATAGDRMNSARPASAEIYPIRRAGIPTRGASDYDPNFVGFTRVWKAEDVGTEVQGVKATGPDRFIWREGSASARQMEYDDTTYRKCAFAQLSPQMQATVRQYRPQLDGGLGTQASAGAQAPSRVAFPPIEQGYWTWSASCAQAIRNNELIYIDDKRWSGADILRVNDLGGNRYRLYTSFMDEDGPVVEPNLENNDKETLTIHSRTRFSGMRDDDTSPTNYIHCPTSQIPASVRRDYEE
jgi:hypothetical protein